MKTLEEVLRISHDWALDRADDLYHSARYDDGNAIMSEFYEWFDPEIEEHDVFSLTFQPTEE